MAGHSTLKTTKIMASGPITSWQIDDLPCCDLGIEPVLVELVEIDIILCIRRHHGVGDSHHNRVLRKIIQ